MIVFRSAAISCSNTATGTLSIAQTDDPFGRAAMAEVSTKTFAIPTLATMSVSVGAPVAYVINCQRFWLPHRRPMQVSDAPCVRVVVMAPVDPLRPKHPMPVNARSTAKSA